MLTLNPCFPKHWPEIRARVTLGGGDLAITIDNAAGSGHGVAAATLDGRALRPVQGQITLSLAQGLPDAPGSPRNLRLTLG
jgi:cyclic beta-1,2-glucan synthetase